VVGAASGDVRDDAHGAQQTAVLVVVVAAVGVDSLWPAQGAATSAADRRDRLDERQELSDVVAVAAGESDSQRQPVRVADQVMLGAGPGTVDRARAGQVPPFRALICEPSTQA
jgi:hypothetical protein